MMPPIARTVIGTVLFVALRLGAAAEVPAAPAPSDQTIAIKDMHFQPAVLTVSAGTSISWKNLDEEPHTVASVTGQFRSEALDQNDRFTFTFAKPGTYRYVCSIHPHMLGTVIVQ